MIALLGSVLTASFLGSLHCAGMCGPIAATALTPLTIERRGPASPAVRPRAGLGGCCGRPSVSYHLGRLVSYATLGALAGGIGGTFDLAGAVVGLSRPAAVIAGVLLIAGGLAALAAHVGIRSPDTGLGRLLAAWLPRLHRPFAKLTPSVRSGAIGLLTALLPCGWLWAFLLVSTATGEPLTGAAVMAAFWLGTVPALAAATAGLKLLSWPIRRHAPALAAVSILVLGVLAISGRFAFMPGGDAAKPDGSSCPLCNHDDAAKPQLPVTLPVSYR